MKIRKRFPVLLGFCLLAAVSVTACGNAQGKQEAQETDASQSQKMETEFQPLVTVADPEKTGENDTPKDSDAAEDPGLEASSKDTAVTGAVAVTGAAPADGEELAGIPIDREKAEAVSIYYGSICYSFFSEEREAIDQVAELFTGFSLEEAPDGQLDADTTYQIYFSTDTEQVAAVNVDKNGMFYLPEEKKFYRVKAGVFHFETLDKIYRDSMNADGFDEDQCLIR